MLDGLYVSLVGLGAVFVSLIVIMLIMMGVERIFHGNAETSGKMPVTGRTITKDGPVAETVKPESQAEIAAIVLAIASYMKEHGRQMGQSIAIQGTDYQVEVGDIADDPISVVVNGERYQGILSDHGLSMNLQTGLRIVPGTGDRKRGRIWRSAYPLLQGGYWTRHGWTSKR